MKPNILRVIWIALLAIAFAFDFARPAGASVITGGTPPATGPAPGEQGTALSAGLYTFSVSDFVLAGPLGLKVDRVYRSNDVTSAGIWNARSFGVGFSLNYDMFLYSRSEASNQGFSDAELVLPDGGQVYCARTSTCTQQGCTDYTDATFTCTQGPLGPYYGATISYDSGLPGWDMTLKDHSIYRFGLGAPMQSVTDRNGNSVTLTRSGGQNGKITQILDSNDRYVDLYYNNSNEPNLITEAVDNSGRTIFYSYDQLGRLLSVTVGSNNNAQQEYAYVNSGNQLGNIQTTKVLESVTSGTANYITTTVSYNGINFLSQTATGNTIFSYSYTNTGVNISEPDDEIRSVQFNSAGYITSDTQASGSSIAETTTYARNPTSGFINTVTDQLGRETCYAYDSLENVTSVTQLCGGWNGESPVTTSFTYGACSQLASVTDPDNLTVSGTFDSNCDLLTVSGGPTGTTTYTYNSAGEATSVKDGNSNQTTITYNNPSLDLASFTDPLQHTFSFTEDGHGNLATVVDPYNHSASYSWTGVGSGWSGGIYPDQNISATDANGKTTSISYEYLGVPAAVTDANGHQTTYAFGGFFGSGISISETDPNGNNYGYVLDNAGNLSLSFDAYHNQQEITYDALQRVWKVIGKDTITYTYDLGNRMLSAVDTAGGSPSSPGNTITRTYDGLDRILSETKPEGTVSYTYDPAGLRQSMTAGTQATVLYSYDNTERLGSVGNGTFNAQYSYDGGGRRTGLTLPYGVSESYIYDSDSHVTAINYLENGSFLENLEYSYDSDGRRLTTYGSIAGAVLTFPPPVSSATYGNANQLSTWNGTNATNDLNNNLTFNPASNDTYTWNRRNELATTSSGYTYYYDSFKRRETVAQGSTTTSYLYDGVFPVQTSNSSSGTTNYLTAPGGQEQLAITTSAGTSVPIHDALGSTIGLVNSAGTLTQLIGYTPYGQPTSSAGQFTGQQWDSAASLIPFPARSYSPVLGRFLSEDPLGFEGGSTNLFQYANSNPVNFTDPMGLAIFAPGGARAAGALPPLSPEVGGLLGGVAGTIVGTAVAFLLISAGILSAEVLVDVLIAAGIVGIVGVVGTLLGESFLGTVPPLRSPIVPIGPVGPIGPLGGLGGGGSSGFTFLGVSPINPPNPNDGPRPGGGAQPGGGFLPGGAYGAGGSGS
jgi:RHS repeat-associated protein